MQNLLLQHCLIPLISTGPAATETILMFCSRSVSTLSQKPEDLQEEYLQVILPSMRVLRAMATICKPNETAHLADALTLVSPSMSATSDKSGVTIMQATGAVLVGTKSWDTIVADIKQKSQSTRDNLPKYMDVMGSLEQIKDGKGDLPSAAEMKSLLEDGKKLFNEVREGMVTSLKVTIGNALTYFVEKTLAPLRAQDSSVGDAIPDFSKVDLKTLEDIISSANSSLEYAIFPAAKYKEEVERYSKAAQTAGVKIKFIDAMRVIDAQWVQEVVGSDCNDFAQAVRDVRAFAGEVDLDAN
eukprot:876373-Pyramimonas_sp.AAC.1